MPSPIAIDPKALSILCATFWSPRGWRDNPSTPPGDLAYARSHGLMFEPSEVIIDHDAVVARARTACAVVTEAQVAAAFVASLGSRRLDWRSALGSWAFGRSLSAHPYERPAPSVACAVCGAPGRSTEKLDVLSFERHKWGGVRHDQPIYIALDLERFALGGASTPTDEDADILRAVVAAARSLPKSARRGHLVKALAPLLKSNAQERDVLLSILGYCGVLHDPAHPAPLGSDLTHCDRERARSPSGGDAPYPIDQWRGAHGVDEANAQRLFSRWL